MKRTTILIAIALSLISFNLIAGGRCCPKKVKKSCKDLKRSERYKGYAESYKKQAASAEKKGNKKLAEALKKCAAAKLKLSQAYASGDNKLEAEGMKEYTKACKERDAAKAMKKNCKTKKTCTKKKACSRKKASSASDDWDGKKE